MEWQGEVYRLLIQSHYFLLLENWSASSGRILHNTVNCALPVLHVALGNNVDYLYETDREKARIIKTITDLIEKKLILIGLYLSKIFHFCPSTEDCKDSKAIWLIPSVHNIHPSSLSKASKQIQLDSIHFTF